MQNPNTPEELQQAHAIICGMRGIDPEAVREPAPVARHITRDCIEYAHEQAALRNETFVLHGVNFTPIPYSKYGSDKQIKSAQENAKKSSFGKFHV